MHAHKSLQKKKKIKHHKGVMVRSYKQFQLEIFGITKKCFNLNHHVIVKKNSNSSDHFSIYLCCTKRTF